MITLNESQFAGPILSNISQVAESRELFCKTDSGLLNRLIPFVKYDDSIVRRGGIIGLIRNICFDTSLHSYLLEEIEILPVILYSLAGPEEYSEDENDKFAIELQVCSHNKDHSFKINLMNELSFTITFSFWDQIKNAKRIQTSGECCLMH